MAEDCSGDRDERVLILDPNRTTLQGNTEPLQNARYFDRSLRQHNPSAASAHLRRKNLICCNIARPFRLFSLIAAISGAPA
jgi:hypothetical protein